MSRTPLVCFGDSITECAGYSETDRWPARLAFLLESRSPGKFNVHNRGIGGNTTALALDRIDRDVLPLLPGIVLIEFGINDAYVFPGHRIPRVSLHDYGRNIREIVRLVSEKGRPVVILNHPVTGEQHLHRQGNGGSIANNLAPYQDALREIVCGQRLACVDLPRLFREQDISPELFLSSDGVHLSPEGNGIYARLVFEDLIRLIAGPEGSIMAANP